jgi:hypothetical protein
VSRVTRPCDGGNWSAANPIWLASRLRAHERGRHSLVPVFGSGLYELTGAVWASIVRSSVPAVIGTLRGLAASATGMRSVSTPVS